MSDADHQWATALTSTGPDGVFLRGRPVAALMRQGGFVSTLLLLWTGQEPTPQDVQLIEACLVGAVDHGALTPSALTARTAASTGNRPLPAAATGLLATGPLHGAAVSDCAALLGTAPEDDPTAWADDVVATVRSRRERVPGVGHRWHREDPRTVVLFRLLEQQGRGERWMAAANALAGSLARATGKHQCVNVDGALAVSLLTVGLPPAYGDCLFGVARLAGLSAHVVEERSRQRPMRVIEPRALVYDGPAVQAG